MDIPTETKRISSRTNKYQKRDLFRRDEMKDRKSSSRMGLFHSSVRVKILNVWWPFITWWSEEGQFNGWIKIKNCMRFNIKTTSTLFVGITVKGGEFIIHVDCFDANNIFSDRFLRHLKHIPNVVQDLSTPIKKAL